MRECWRRWGIDGRGGFTLVEVLVALALVGLVVIPSTVALHRLLRGSAQLRDALQAELAARQALEGAAFEALHGMRAAETTVTHVGGTGPRIVTRCHAASPAEPAHITVEAARGDATPRLLSLVLPPAGEHPSPPP